MADGCQKQSWHEVDILLAVPDRHCLVTGRAFWDFYNSFFLVPRADGHSSDRRSEFAPSVRRSPRRQIGPENQGFHDSPPRPSVLLLYYVCKEGLWRKGGVVIRHVFHILQVYRLNLHNKTCGVLAHIWWSIAQKNRIEIWTFSNLVAVTESVCLLIP